MNNNESKSEERIKNCLDCNKELDESDYRYNACSCGRDIPKVVSKTSGVRDIEKLKLEFIEYWQGKTLDELCGKDVWSFFLPHLQSKGKGW